MVNLEEKIMNRKIKLIAILLFTVFFCAASSQAALLELEVAGGSLPDLMPGAGSVEIDVFLTDLETAPDIGSFNLWIGASGPGAIGLTGDPMAYTDPDYIFQPGFAYTVVQMDPLSVAAMDSNNGTSQVPGLLATLTLDYECIAGTGGIDFFLVDPSQNFMTCAAGGQFDLTLDGDTHMDCVPIPAAVWLLGSGVLGLVAFRRRMTN